MTNKSTLTCVVSHGTGTPVSWVFFLFFFVPPYAELQGLNTIWFCTAHHKRNVKFVSINFVTVSQTAVWLGFYITPQSVASPYQQNNLILNTQTQIHHQQLNDISMSPLYVRKKSLYEWPRLFEFCCFSPQLLVPTDSNSFVSTARRNSNRRGGLSALGSSAQWMDSSHHCPATIVHIHSASVCFHQAPLVSSSSSPSSSFSSLVSSCQQERFAVMSSRPVLFLNAGSAAWKFISHGGMYIVEVQVLCVWCVCVVCMNKTTLHELVQWCALYLNI